MNVNQATPIHEATQVELESGEKATVTFEPEESGTTAKVPIVAIDRRQDSTYQIDADGTTRFEEAAIPPTDTNDLSRRFYPPLSFSTKLTVIIRNASPNRQTYAVQVIGGEVADGT